MISLRIISHRFAAVFAAAITLTACMGGEKKGAETAPADTAFTRLGETSNLNTPEGARYDADLDVFFISNINGVPSAKDNNGYIARVNAAATDSSTQFIRGGQGGVTLHAPKGMAIVGDTLWVADIDVLRGFNKRTGESVANITFSPAPRFLNDVAAAPDGEIYITDTSIQITASGMRYFGQDKLYAVKGRTTRVVVEGQNKLAQPNGITWDAGNNRLLMAPFGGQSIAYITQSNTQPIPIAGGQGGYDGIEVLPDGRIIVTSWQDSTVNVVLEGALKKVITGVPEPADIGIDTKRMVLALPRFSLNRVEYYHIPSATPATTPK